MAADDTWDTDVDGEPWIVLADGSRKLRPQFEVTFRCEACGSAMTLHEADPYDPCRQCGDRGGDGGHGRIMGVKYMGRGHNGEVKATA